MENESETQEVPHIQRAFRLVVGRHTSFGGMPLQTRQQHRKVHGGSVVVGQSHGVWCRDGGLSDDEQDVLQANVLPLGTVVVGLAEAVGGVVEVGCGCRLAVGILQCNQQEKQTPHTPQDVVGRWLDGMICLHFCC